LDDVVCRRQNSASAVQGPPFSCSACVHYGVPHRDPSLAPFAPLVCGSNRPNRCSARAQVPQYADGCQIYVATSVRAVHSAIDQLSGCLHDVDVWMSASRLRLNASKTQVLWLGSRYNIDRLTVQEVPVLSSTVGVVANMVDRTTVVGSPRDLLIDHRVSMADHVASVCRSAYYHLRHIRPMLQSLSLDAAKTLIQAFISSCLDYSNSVLYGVTYNLLQRLQSVYRTQPPG